VVRNFVPTGSFFEDEVSKKRYEELAEEVHSFVAGGVCLFRQLAQKAMLWQTKI